MKPWLPLLLAAGVASPVPGWLSEPPDELLPWLYNARERSAEARQAFVEGDGERALEAARIARRLAPGDARTELNYGTALLGAGRQQEAAEHLAAAASLLERSLADGAPVAGLAATAQYNRGNALFGSGDYAAAVAAYEQALRHRPEHGDAKFNLELALRELARQRQQQQQQSGGQQQDESETSQDGSGGGSQADQPPDRPQPDPAEPGEQEQPQPSPADGEPQPAPADPRLPDFEEQPDMTAEEAAAILEAVENLERQQRRLEAARRARAAAGREKDW